MITITSRDPITLWSDICSGWLSGQEQDWIEEVEGARYYSYSNLFTCHWDYHSVEHEGRSILSACAIKNVKGVEVPGSSKDAVLVKPTPWGELHILTKKSGAKQVHLYTDQLELCRGFLKLMVGLQTAFHTIGLSAMIPTAIHSTCAYFNRVNLPFLYAVFGRRVFLDTQLTILLNRDIDNLKKILSKDYRNKGHQRVWKHVVEILGKENIL